MAATRLTRRDERLLRRTADAVRMYVALVSFLAPILCVVFASDNYAGIHEAGGIPEIPPAATYGTIAGIYLPIFAAVAAYVWATRSGPTRALAPKGYAMALFRDAFTFLVVSVALLLPVALYAADRRIQDVNTFLVWYQTIMTAMAGAAFTYYFHANIAPASSGAPEGEGSAPRRPRSSPRAEAAGAAAKSPRRARKAAAKSAVPAPQDLPADAAPSPEPTDASS